MKRWLRKSLAILNSLEGVIHLIVALVSLWGIAATHTWDWRVLAAPLENAVFGAFSLWTGYVLGKDHHKIN